MAVDLTPRFRRLNSQTRSFRENAQLCSSGPFRATQLWRSLILALHTQLEVRPRRKHLRTYADCFTGSDAVDVLLSHLMQNIFFCSSEVSRLKAARLCQALMEARVFEPVGIKLFRTQKETAFEDSSCSLYRFLDRDALPGSAEKSSGDKNLTPEEAGWRRKKVPRLDHMRTISNPLAMESSDKRVEKLLQTINLQPSSAVRTAPPSSFLSKRVVEEVWKQQTLLQLLQVVEVPVLDSILTSPAKTEPHRSAPLCNRDDLVISNTCLDREVTQSLNLPELDSWLAAAADCLEHFPDQLIVVAGEHLLQQGGADGDKSLDTHKRLLFDTIAKYYSSQERVPLLTGRYLDILSAILELLDCGKQEESLTASQLCLRLLEPNTRDELRSLLGFMAAAAQPDAIRLHKQADNRTMVSRTFLKAIVQNNDLTRTKSEQLVLFLMDSQPQLFKTPASLIEAVSKRLQALQQGGDPDTTATFSFCQRVTVQQYEDQREKATLESLKQLIHDISLNASLPLKEKRRLVKDFQKHHPVVFLQHFSSTF